LGLAGAVIGVAVLSGLKRVEKRIRQDRQGTLRIIMEATGPAEREIRAMLRNDGFSDRVLRLLQLTSRTTGNGVRAPVEVSTDDTSLHEALQRLLTRNGVTRMEWAPQVPSGF
jgi:hypothetical protein